MSNYLKNQGTWKLSQLKKCCCEEIKEEFEKIDDNNVSDTKEKVGKVKEEGPVKRVGKRKKQKTRKGISIDKSPQGDSETNKEESVEAMNPTPLDTKSNIVANWKIFQQGERSICQIIRANGADTVYMSFGAMLKDFTREDLIELYRTMFDPPLNEDAIWSLPLQQKMISWRYYDKCELHCLTLEAELATPEQTATGKEKSNPVYSGYLLKHHSDDEASYHEDASDNGTATNKPKQQQQQLIPTTTTISNIKLLILKKEEMEIQRRESQLEKMMLLEYFSSSVAEEIHVVEKERKARTILLMAIPKEHLRRFHGMDNAKEI
ncbi:hypothetical protein Tco_0804018 [Tanacetum coccineum]|uniref:Uncharacterized protein n=1 Tax=Tanacetum coccineum TaxID=301880 RepID=A0ABQ5A357_9ASTR